jgi:hypothetical protein
MRFVLVAAALAALALPPAHAADGDKAGGARAAAKMQRDVKKDAAAAERSDDRKKDAAAAERSDDRKKDAAAEHSDDRKKDVAAERSDDRKKDARGGDDLTTCKRDADGMRGPERSRFMTDCLKERR